MSTFYTRMMHSALISSSFFLSFLPSLLPTYLPSFLPTFIPSFLPSLRLLSSTHQGAILTDYQQGRSHFDHDDVSAMLLETLMGSMHFLRGEFLYTELKTVTALGDMLTLAKAKVKDGDMTPVRQAFAKQLSALRSFAGRMIKGVDGLDENIDPASRWQITDQHVILSIQLKDARPLLLNVQLLAALFDNLGEKIIADLCYDAGLVKNLEHIIKIALRSAEVLHESSKSGDRALNEMAKVRNWLRSGRKAPRVTTFKRELGMFTDDEANSIVERFEDRLLAEAASDGGGGGGGGSSGGSEEGGAKGIGEDTFLELVVSLCRDAGDKLPGKKDMEKIMEHVRARALPVRDGEAFLRLFASVVAVGKGRSLGVLLDLGAAGTSGGRKKERRASISTSTKAQQ